jgi:hypothetical protein
MNLFLNRFFHTILIGLALILINGCEKNNEKLNSLTWEKSFGGSGDERANSIQQTSDGGYIIAGSTNSIDGDITANKGLFDCWVLKISATGEVEWQNTLGGSFIDAAHSIQQTIDGGYIMAGETSSEDGDVSYNHGSVDYWIIKLSSVGKIDWQKSFGGSKSDKAKDIQQTTDGGYILVGYSGSEDGDITESKGSSDQWILKLSSAGDIEWQKSIGERGIDEANSVQQTSDGGYIIAGTTSSWDDEIGRYLFDYNIVKFSNLGELEWQKSFGGSKNEKALSIKQAKDGGYIAVGYTESSDGDIRESLGGLDGWVLKLNTSGELEWQKSIGGISTDGINSVQLTTDGGYILAGSSFSPFGTEGIARNSNFYIIKLTSTGEIEWQKSYGGNSFDGAYSVQQAIDGGYIVAGYSESNDLMVSENKGGEDIWILKLNSKGEIE